MEIKKSVYVAAGSLAALILSGCANWGETEPVLGGNGEYQPAYNVTQPAATPEYTEAKEAQPSLATIKNNRELAGFKADVDSLMEKQKMLEARIMGLEQDNMRKDAQIKELQSLLADMDKRFVEVDKGWRARMSDLSSTIDSERKQRMREMETIVSEMDKKSAVSATPHEDFIIFEVQQGDTLGAIANQAKVSVAEIKKLNKMTSDKIYVKQKLKIPVKK